MMKVLLGMLLVLTFAIPTAALEITAPEVPQTGLDAMPQNTDSFGAGFTELMHNSIALCFPALSNAVSTCYGILATAMLVSLLSFLAERAKGPVTLAGIVIIASAMFQQTSGMVKCAFEAVQDICEYGKLLFPVLTTALAAQGGITSSAALYSGTAAFITLLTMLINKVIVPMVYLFLAFSIAHCAMEEEMMKKFSDAVKSFLSWLLKTLLIVFTAYLSITGAVSGTTDAATLKAAKITVSTVVPVVGGILSDASESVLISMEIMKNAAGIYGIFAVLAVFVGPFIKIGAQYLVLKISGAICNFWGNKQISILVESFSSAMGLLLGMTAAGCMLVLISTVCYLKGIS